MLCATNCQFHHNPTSKYYNYVLIMSSNIIIIIIIGFANELSSLLQSLTIS